MILQELGKLRDYAYRYAYCGYSYLKWVEKLLGPQLTLFGRAACFVRY